MATLRIRRCNRAALLQATALRAAFVVVFTSPAAAQLSPGAHPTGGTVVGGHATIGQNGNTTTIDQASQRAAINWQSFNVGSQQTVNFVQPNGQAIALNTVVGPNPSEIAGRIDANGQIVIVNQSGVVFDHGAQVDTEGLTVSAAGITNQNFMAGHMVFNQAPHPGASITNAGTITVSQAGLAALVAPRVANSGIIRATLGRVILAGAATYTLDLYGDGLLALNVTSQVTNVLLNGQTVPALVTNTGTIVANGGTVVLTASAADGLIRTLVNAGGTIAANSVGSSTGTILAQGIGGSVEIDGDVTATGTTAGTRGGQIVANATGNVTVGANAVLDTSGNAGGGMIAVGTTASRAAGGPNTPSSMTAGTTTIAAGAQLRANATGNGHGGRITVLSRQQTNFAGTLAAHGGAQGGNGGWVELSSLGSLNYNGSIDTSAPLGIAGNILIDPLNLEITSGKPLTGFTKITPTQVNAMTGSVDLSATDTLLLQSAVTANAMATSFELDAGISLIIDANLNASGIPVTLMGGTTGLLLQGGTVTGSALTLMSQGIISQTGGAISATSLTGSAAGDVTLQSSTNSLATLGAFTSGGAFSLTDSQALTVDAAVTAADGLALTAPSLTIATTGTITGAPILLVANQFDLSGSVTASGSGLVAIDLLTAGTLSVGGAHSNFSTAGLGNIVAGTLALGSIDGLTAAPQTSEIDFDSTQVFTNVATLGLFATGLVTDAAGGIKVADLYGVAGTATLTGANTVTTLNSLSATASLLQFDDSAALTITGDVTGATGVVISAAGLSQTAGTVTATSGDITLTSAGSLAIGGVITATSVMLGASGGDISESGAITATSLTGSASGAITLNGTTNDVADLNALTATAGAVTFDDAANLSVTGPLTASAGVTIAVSGPAHTLGLAANITGADVTLSAPGGITQTSGVITANTTTIALASGIGGISLGGTLDAATSLSLSAGGGDIAETVVGVSGAVTASSLSGSASGAVTLDSGANDIGTITGLVASAGALTLDDEASLSITAPVTASGAVDITLTGPTDVLGLAANITGSSVTLTAPGSITQTSGIVTATATDVGLNSTGGGIALGGTLMAASAISLNAGGGDIIETVGAGTGTLLASSLTGSASGMVTLDSTANSITTLASLTAAAGALTFDDTPDLTISGPVTASGDVTIASTAALTQSSNKISSAGGDVSLSAGTGLGIGGVVSGVTVTLVAKGGDITETVAGGSGSVIATTLDPSATGAITLDSGTNDFAAIGAVSIGTNLTLDDTVPLDITVALRGTTLSLTAPSLTIAAGGGLTANDIILRADAYDLLAAVNGTTLVALGLYTPGGTLTIGGATSSIAGLTEITAGTLALGSLDGATPDPNVEQLDIDGATDFTAIAPVVGLFASGLVSDTAGGITAANLYGTAGTATLNGANAIGTLLSYSTTAGALQLAVNTALTIAGNVTGDTGVLIAAAGLAQTAGTIAATTGGLALNSSGALAIGGTLTAATITLGASGGDITESGAIIATSLSGSASGALTLGGTTNDIGTVTNLTATTGAVTFADQENLSVAGPVDAAGAISIAVSGNGNTLGIAADITGSTVSLSAPGAITQTAGTVQATEGDIDIDSAASGLAIGGTLSATAGTVSLIAGAGDVTETVAGATTGVVAAATVTGSATGGSVLLTNAANQVAALGAFPASADFEFSDADAFSVTGAISAGATLMLQGPGITVSAAGSLAGTPIVLQADAFDLIGGISSIGLVAIDRLTAGTLALGGANDSFGGAGLGAITAGTLVLGSLNGVTAAAETTELDLNAVTDFTSITPTLGLFSTGAILEPGGISVVQLYGTAGSAALSGTNSIATLNGFTTTSGDFALTDAAGLDVNQTVSAAGMAAIAATGAAGALTIAADITGTNVTLSGDAGLLQTAGTVLATTGNVSLASSGGTVSFAGTVTAPGTVTLTAGLDIDEPGTLNAGTLTGSAGGSANLAGTNNVAALGDFQANAFTLIDTPNLAVIGTVGGGATVAITDTGALSIPGTLAALSTSLVAASIDETGSIVTGTLTGSATGTASFSGANQIAALGDFASAGFALNDTQDLAVTGTVNGAASVAIADAGTLTIPGTIIGGLTSLTATAIGESGSIQATSLTGSTTGTAAFTGSNQIASLGDFAADGFTLNDAPNLAVTGTVNGGASVAMTDTGTLTIPGTLIGGLTSLTAAAIGETGSIQAATLTGRATGTASFTGSNQIAALGDFSAAGFTLTDTPDLAVTGTIDGTSIAITDTGTLTIPGTLIGNLTTLTAAAIGETGAIQAATLTGSATGTAAFTGTNQIAALGNFTAAGFSLTDTPDLAVTGTVNGATSVSIADTGTLTIPGTLIGSLTTLTAASIGESGSIQATTLTGSTTGTASFAGSNQIAALGDFSSAGFSLNDAPNLAVTGTVNGGTSVAITDIGTLTIPGTIIGGLTSLAAAAIAETGSLQAATLTGSTTGTAAFTGTNQIAALGDFTSAGFSLNDTPNLAVTGTVNGGPEIVITDSGTLTIPGTIIGALTSLSAAAIGETGSIQAATLTGSSTGTAGFTGSNQIASLADFTAAGFSLNDTPDLAVTGTLNGGAEIAITDAGTLTIPGTIIGGLTSLAAAAIGETGSIQSATLTGSATGTAAFTGTNQIAALGDFTATGFTLLDTPNLAVTGTVNGDTSVAITDTGTVTVPGTLIGSLTSLTAAAIGETGSIQAATLTGSATGTAAFSGSNQIASLGDFTAAGFSLSDTPNLAVTGTLDGGASAAITDTGTLSIPGTIIGGLTSLTAAAIGETGSIQSATLTGSATGTAAFTGTNQIAALGDFTAAGFTLLDTPNLAVAGTVDGNTAITISDTGTLTIPGTLVGGFVSLTAAAIGESGSISAATLTGSATFTAALTGSNSIGTLSDFSAAGFTLNDTPNLAVTGTVNGGTEIAITDAGTLTIPGTMIGATTSLAAAAIGESGTIQATTLTGSATGTASFSGSNQIATLGDFTAAGFLLNDAPDLAVTGTVNGGASVAITDTGTLTIPGALTGALTSLAAAAIGETGSIEAATLTGSATGTASFAGDNQIATLGNFTAAGFLLTDTPNLAVTGTVNGGASIAISDAGTLTVPGTLIGAGTTLTAAAIGETGTIQATTLTGSATGTASFSGSNQIATLGDFTAAGFLLNDAPNLAVTGTVDGGASITLTDAGTLSIPGTLIGSLTSLTAAAIGETGTMEATTLTGSATGTASFAGSNQIASLADFTAAGFTLNDTPNLAVTGTINGGASIAITDTGTLTVPGTLIGGLTTLTAAAIGETGSIQAATLTGSSTGTAAFTGDNQIAALGDFSAVGFTLNDTPNLAVTGTVNGAAAIAITDTGTLTIPGTLIGSLTSLTAAAIGEAGTIEATTLTGSASGTASFAGSNQIASLGDFSSAGFLLSDAPNLAVTGTINGDASIAITDTGTLTIPGTLIGATTTLAAAAIVEPGTIKATTLTGSATGTAAFTGTNQIATLGNFTAAGFTLTDTPNLAVTGSVNGATSVLITDTGTLTIPGTLIGSTTTLTAAAIGEPGAIDAATLTGSATGTASFSGSNQIASLGNFSAAGFSLNDTPNLAITGTVNGAASIAISDTGTLTIPGTLIGNTTTLTAATIGETGTIEAATLTGSATGTASFTGSNQVATLGDFTATGFTLTDTPNLAVTGSVNGATSVLITDAGTLTIQGTLIGATTTLTAAAIGETGTIEASLLTGSATGAASLTGKNQIAALGNFSSAGFTLTDTADLAVTGTVNGFMSVSIDDTGNLTIPGTVIGNLTSLTAASIAETGTIQASTLTASATGTASFTGANQIASFGNVTAAGFAFDDTANLSITGTIDGGASIAINDAGTLTIPGTLIGASTLLKASAIAETGSIRATTLAGSATNAASFTGQNQIATLGNFTAAGFTLRDTPNLAIIGTVNGGAAISISDAGALTIPGTLAASLTALTAASIAEPGTIDATTLTGSTTGATAFSGSNQIATLGNFTAASLTLNDTPNLAVTGTIDGGTAVLITDAGNLTIPGAIIAAGTSLTAASIGETGSIQTASLTGRSTGAASFIGNNQIASLGNFTAAAFTLDDTPNLAVTGTVDGGTSIALTDAGNLAVPGTLIATSTSLTASTIGETGSIRTTTLTGNTQGSASFTGDNSIATLNRFNAGAGALLLDDAASLSVLGGITADEAVTISVTGTGNTLGITGDITGADVVLAANSSITQTNGLLLATSTSGMLTLDAANLVSLNGALDATTIAIGDIDAPHDVDLNNVNITTGSDYRPGTPKPIFPKTFPPGPVTDKGFFVYAKDFHQTGTMKVNGDGAAATVDITITGSGAIAFDPSLGLYGPATELFLNLARGTASGHVDVAGLNVSYTPPGAPNLSQLTGIVGGLNGQPAAGMAYIIPLPNANYRINACAIQSVDCILLSPVVVPVGNPIENVEVDSPRRRHADDDLVLPNVSEEDF